MSPLIAITSAVFFSFSFSYAALAGDDDQRRQLDAHEHGHSTLNVGIEGKTVTMELEAPGADIVGFEYVAATEADKASVAAAKAALANPLSLFTPTAAAGCTLVSTDVDLIGGGKDSHDAHDEDHKDEKHTDGDHNGEEHKKHDKDTKHDDDQEDHEKHDDAEAGGHNEFRATYALTCSNPGALKGFSFSFFDTFKGAEELEVNVVSEKGQRRFEVERDAPSIDLGSLT